MRRLWRGLRIALGTFFVLVGLLVALVGTGVVGPPKVSAQAIRTSVIRTPARLEAAWALPVAATYRAKLYSQSNGSVCGPASLVNVFRSLGQDAADERSLLAGTGKCSLGFCMMGLTLDELAEVARAKTSRRVTVLRDLGPDQFREHLRRSNDPAYRYVVNFSRKPIFGAGGGHHSPIGGYVEADDTVLVLDVNADFAPWLIERERLYAAMNTLDGDKKRGLLLIE